MLAAMKTKPRILAQVLPTPREIFAFLDKHIIGQERAKRTIAIAAYNHLKRCDRTLEAGTPIIKKSNILLMGPTGCGKTHIARTLAEFLDVPFSVADATEYTEAGYYGKDVEVMLGELLHKAGHDVESAERGIVFVDEVDKIARRTHSARTGAGARDIGGEGVQQSLLKLLEGREVFVPQNVTQHWNKHDFVPVDTHNILFICAGTFTDLRPYEENKSVGFGREVSDEPKHARPITEKDLIEYGLLAEFLGRLPVRVEMDALSEDDLLQILTVPPDSVVREYSALLATDGVDLRFEEGALREVAAFSRQRKTGARILRGLVEEICHDLMFEAPERRGETVVIDARMARDRLERLGDTTNAR
jgi:ATP-dependent Clp protease ATP-binding subunit ClpX